MARNPVDMTSYRPTISSKKVCAMLSSPSSEPEREVHIDRQRQSQRMMRSSTSALAMHHSRTASAVSRRFPPLKVGPPVSMEDDEDEKEKNGADSNDDDDDDVSHIGLELGSSYSWSSDEKNNALWNDHESSIHSSIVAIREEASRTDAILALDQLHTMRQELGSMNRELCKRNNEVEKLQALVQLKDDRMAMLELERDLYQAESRKFKHDLEQYVSSPLQQPPKIAVVRPTEEEAHSVSALSFSAEVTPVAVLSERAPAPGRGDPLEKTSSHGGKASGKLSPSSHPRTESTTEAESSLPSRRKGKEGSRTRHRANWFRRGLASSASATTTSHSRMDGITLKTQVEYLQLQLREALATSDRLRQRLAMISRYYENLVRSLQENVETVQAEKARMEKDLVNQISDLMRENEHLHLQSSYEDQTGA